MTRPGRRFTDDGQPCAPPGMFPIDGYSIPQAQAVGRRYMRAAHGYVRVGSWRMHDKCRALARQWGIVDRMEAS